MFKLFKKSAVNKDIKTLFEALKVMSQSINNIASARNNDAHLVKQMEQRLATVCGNMDTVFAKSGNRDIEIRQFSAQIAALCIQREGGDVIHLARKIQDYIIDSPNQALTENIIPLITKH